jgi:putative hemolysin
LQKLILNQFLFVLIDISGMPRFSRLSVHDMQTRAYNRLVSTDGAYMNKILLTFSCMTLSLSWTTISRAGVELPNPASQLCVELGGTLQPYVQEDGGAVSLCAFQDDVYLNGIIEEWTLFRFKQEGAAPSLAVNAFLDHIPYQAPEKGPVGNPASRYCGQVGGTTEIITASTGDQTGICRFKDGSQMEEWTLFRGPEVHQGLARILGD